MSKEQFKVGDRVRAVHQDGTELVGLVDQNLGFAELPLTFAALRAMNFSLLLVESAPTPLPTASGFYVDEQGDHWRLNGGGGWDCLDSPTDSNNPQHFAPFTRLEPVPDVARTVLERVRELLTDRLNASAAIQVHSVLHVVELENGVTS